MNSSVRWKFNLLYFAIDLPRLRHFFLLLQESPPNVPTRFPLLKPPLAITINQHQSEREVFISCFISFIGGHTIRRTVHFIPKRWNSADSVLPLCQHRPDNPTLSVLLHFDNFNRPKTTASKNFEATISLSGRGKFCQAPERNIKLFLNCWKFKLLNNHT